VRADDSTAKRQNPNPSYYEGFGTPRVSIVPGRDLVPRTEGFATRPRAERLATRPPIPSDVRETGHGDAQASATRHPTEPEKAKRPK
jgi:hypothetical protein